MFVVEEASSFFPHHLFFRTLCATAIATFCLAIHHGNLSEYSVISLDAFQSKDRRYTSDIFLARFAELPLYALNAAVGGALGGLFVMCWKRIQEKRRKILSTIPNPYMKALYKVSEVVVLSILTSSVTFALSMSSWACKDMSRLKRKRNGEWAKIQSSLLCEEGKFNELAAVLFGGRDDPIRAILANPNQFDKQTLLSVGLAVFPLMILTLGVALPTGIFMPTFLIGCSLGGAAGIVYNETFSCDISPSTFALLGAASLLTGIQRSTVSLCVILVEGTGQVKVLIPVIVTIVVS